MLDPISCRIGIYEAFESIGQIWFEEQAVIMGSFQILTDAFKCEFMAQLRIVAKAGTLVHGIG